LSRLLFATAAGQTLHGHFGDSVVVNERGNDDAHVEQLVTWEPDVAFAGKETFRNTHGVQESSEDVQTAHQD